MVYVTATCAFFENQLALSGGIPKGH